MWPMVFLPSIGTRPMRRNLWKFLLGLALLGCGGQPAKPAVGFVNRTRHSDAELWTIWQAAQDSIAQEVDLNPLQRSSFGAPADIRPGDRRALEICPTSSTWAPGLM